MTDDNLVTFLRACLDEDEVTPRHSRDCFLVQRGVDMFGGVEPCDCGAEPWMSWPAVRFLAAPYADRPGYRPEWAPGS